MNLPSILGASQTSGVKNEKVQRMKFKGNPNISGISKVGKRPRRNGERSRSNLTSKGQIEKRGSGMRASV